MPTIQTGDFETHYEEAGEGPAVVLVHAATMDRTSWAEQVADLGRDHRVITYDLRGHGRSLPSRPGRYAIETLAEDLFRFIEALGLERPVVCGLSMGGMAAQAFAARYPEALSGLVLAGTTTPPLLSFGERLQRVVLPRTMILPARLMGYPRLKKGLLRTQERVHGKEAMGSFTVQHLPDMTTGDFVRAIRCFTGFHRVQVDLSRIAVPTLVLVGEKEPAFFQEHAKRLETQVKGARFQVLPGAGHASNFDAPEAFTAAVRSFLEALPVSAPVAPAAAAKPAALARIPPAD